MRLAIICSWLNQYGGAERVLEVLHRTYPEAPVYTAIYRPDALPASFRTWDIRPSFVNRMPFATRYPQYYLNQYPRAFEQFDLRGYDVVLSVTSAFAHGVITSSDTRHVCYCLTPARFLWNYQAYMEHEGVSRLAQSVLSLHLERLRMWDRLAADRVDDFVAISRTVQQRIAKTYRRSSQILYPPVQLGELQPPEAAEDYYLIVSRLIPYKRIDLAIAAFNQLGLPLYIVGEGRDKSKLQASAKSNIRFLGYRSDDEKRQLMARCRAFIFPGEEDFGLAPLEAMAAGRPVVAYAAGGALDTVVAGKSGLYFTEPTPESLAASVTALSECQFDATLIQQHARQFDESVFSAGLRRFLERPSNSSDRLPGSLF